MVGPSPCPDMATATRCHGWPSFKPSSQKGALVHTTILSAASFRDANAAFPQVGNVTIGYKPPSAGGGQAVPVYGGAGLVLLLVVFIVIVLVVVIVVIVPAVWSTSEPRRLAAETVLDKLLRFLRPRH